MHARTAKLETTRKAAEVAAQIRELRTLLDSQPERVRTSERFIPNTGRDFMRSQFYALQVERMELESRAQDAHPLVQSQKRREGDAWRALADETSTERTEVTESLNEIHQSLSLELAQAEAGQVGYTAVLDTLAQQEKLVEQRIAALNEADIEIKQLERELQLAETNFMTYAKHFEEARVDEALNESSISNISIAQQATLQEKPVSPSKAAVGLLGLLMMASGSVALVCAAQLFDRAVHSPRDVYEVLNAPLIVSIPSQRRHSQVLR